MVLAPPFRLIDWPFYWSNKNRHVCKGLLLSACVLRVCDCLQFHWESTTVLTVCNYLDCLQPCLQSPTVLTVCNYLNRPCFCRIGHCFVCVCLCLLGGHFCLNVSDFCNSFSGSWWQSTKLFFKGNWRNRRKTSSSIAGGRCYI